MTGSIEQPRIGDVGLVQVTGLVGWFIDLGQRINDPRKQDATKARYEHAFMYTGDGNILEGQPGGAVIDKVADRYRGRDIHWVRPVPGMTFTQANLLATVAESMVGTKYSFLDYLALAIKRFGLPIPGVEKRVQSTKHMICSQIIVETYRRSGVADLFHDRPSGYVTPEDFAVEYDS